MLRDAAKVRTEDEPMKAQVLLASCALLVVTVVAAAQQASEKSGIGQKIDNVKLTGLDGKNFALYDLKDKKAMVVLMLTFECPVSNSYLAELTELARTCTDTAFIGVCTSADDPAQLAKQVQEFHVGFPVVHDAKHTVVDLFKARVTPELFVLDGQFVLRYRGRMDDAWAARLKRNKQVTRHDLREALDEVRAGKTVTQSVTPAIGCPIVAEGSALRAHQADLLQRRAAHLAETLSAVPSARRDGALFADDICPGGQLGAGHQGIHAEPHHASLEAVRWRPAPG